MSLDVQEKRWFKTGPRSTRWPFNFDDLMGIGYLLAVQRMHGKPTGSRALTSPICYPMMGLIQQSSTRLKAQIEIMVSDTCLLVLW